MPEIVSSLSRALTSSDPEERRQATSRLGRLDLDHASQLLVRALGDEDWRVRKEATLAARAFVGARSLIDTLIDELRTSDNVGLRNAIVDVLASAGHASIEPLSTAFATLDADGRKLVVEIFGKTRDGDALDMLEVALHDPDDNVRAGAIEAIAEIGGGADGRAGDILLARLDDRDPIVRLAALSGLVSLEVSIPWDRLAPLLDEPTLRSKALAAAALTSRPEAARALARALAAARGSAFTEALAGLNRLLAGPLAIDVAAALRAEIHAGKDGAELGERLLKLAADRSADVGRRSMALALAAAARVPSVAAAALDAMAEEAFAGRAEEALRALGEDALPDVIARLEDVALSAEARAALIDVAASVLDTIDEPHDGGTSKVPPGHEPLRALRRAARDPEGQVAARGLVALARLGEELDLEIAADLTLAPSPQIRLAAEGALATLAERFPRAARALVDRLVEDTDRALPAAILIGALGAAGSFEPKDLTFLSRTAAAGDIRTRRAAVDAVSELGASMAALPTSSAVDILSFALADEEREVRVAAARGLGHLAATVARFATDLLELVERTGAADLVAAMVRAIGEAMSPAYQGRRSAPPSLPDEALVAALSMCAREGPGPVAIAAVDALDQAAIAGSASAGMALGAALDHPDPSVVRAALVKAITTRAHMRAAMVMERALLHPSVEVRRLAVEVAAEELSFEQRHARNEGESLRDKLAAHATIEGDRTVRAAIEEALSPRSYDAPPSFFGEGGIDDGGH